MLFDVTLPGQPPEHMCPQRDCEALFQGGYSDNDKVAWDMALQQGPDSAKAHLQASGACQIRHVSTCPFRCLPPAVLALCSDEELLAQHDKVWAVIDDCC